MAIGLLLPALAGLLASQAIRTTPQNLGVDVTPGGDPVTAAVLVVRPKGSGFAPFVRTRRGAG